MRKVLITLAIGALLPAAAFLVPYHFGASMSSSILMQVVVGVLAWTGLLIWSARSATKSPQPA